MTRSPRRLPAPWIDVELQNPRPTHLKFHPISDLRGANIHRWSESLPDTIARYLPTIAQTVDGPTVPLVPSRTPEELVFPFSHEIPLRPWRAMFCEQLISGERSLVGARLASARDMSIHRRMRCCWHYPGSRKPNRCYKSLGYLRKKTEPRKDEK